MADSFASDITIRAGGYWIVYRLFLVLAALAAQVLLTRGSRQLPTTTRRCLLAASYAGWGSLAVMLYARLTISLIGLLAVLFAPPAAATIALSARQGKDALILLASTLVIIAGMCTVVYVGL